MLPNSSLSTESIPDAFAVPARNSPLLDYEIGGYDVGDTSQGLSVKLWRCYYENNIVMISDNANITHNLISIFGITHLSFAFDLNMHPMVVYIKDNICYLWWYDSTQSQYVTTEYGEDYIYPQLSLDDNRSNQSQNADVIFAYIKDENLYYRQQRDRYLTEYLLKNVGSSKLKQIGMSKNSRFQFRLSYDE